MAYTYSGTKITGMSVTAKKFPKSGIKDASKGNTYFNKSTGHVYKCTDGGKAKNAKWKYLKTDIASKPSVAVCGLGAPIRIEGTHKMGAIWKTPAAMIDAKKGDRATALDINWYLGIAGKDPKRVVKTSNEKLTESIINLNKLEIGSKTYERKDFYPFANKPVLNYITVKVTSRNDKGAGASAKATREFHVPRKPTISDFAFDAETGEVSCTIDTDAGNDYYERYDTRYKMTVYYSDTKETKTIYDTSTTDTSKTITFDDESYASRSYGDYAKVTVQAWARGYKGDSAVVERVFYIAYPAQASIDDVQVSSKDSTGKCTIYVNTHSTTEHPVDRVKLEYLANCTYAEANLIPGDAGWEQTEILDDATCKALAMSVSDLIPDRGKYTWIRLKTFHANETVLYRYSQYWRVRDLETPAATAADDRIKILSATAGSDGKSAVIELVWDDGALPSTGTELSWDEEEDAWKSTKDPSEYTFTWSDGPKTIDGNTWGGSATITIKGLDEASKYFVKARRYNDGDEETTYSEYSNSATVVTSEKPESVTATADRYIPHGSGLNVYWTFAGNGLQREWQIVDSNGTILANGEGSLGSTQIPADRLIAFAEDGDIEFTVQVSTGSGFVVSESKKVTIIESPELSITGSSLVHAHEEAERDFSGEIVTFEPKDYEFVKSLKVPLEPIQDLHGYDKPWVGGAGKNKLGISGSSVTSNGITFTLQSDGTIKATGTLSGSSASAYFTASIPTGSYIFSDSVNGSASTYWTQIVDDSNWSGVSTSGSDVNFSIVTNNVRVYVATKQSPPTGGIVFKPMMRLTGTDNTWQPWENICPIYGYGDGAGKNLLNANLGAGSINDLTYTNTNGIIVVNGTASANTYRTVGKFTPQNGVQYIMSGCPSDGANGKWRMTLGGYGYDYGSGYTFTGDGQEHTISCDVYTGAGLVTNLTFRPMIRLASEQDATYEPYKYDGIDIWDDPDHGGLIEWNQLLTGGKGDSATNWNGIRCTVTSNGEELTATCAGTGFATAPKGFAQSPVGHTYLVSFDAKVSATNITLGGSLSSTSIGTNYFLSNYAFASANTWERIERIIVPTDDSVALFRLGTGNATANQTFSFKNVQIFDLTKMFGAGNEPSTVEEFRTLFPKDYYEYNREETTCVGAVNGDEYRHYIVNWQTEAGAVYGGKLHIAIVDGEPKTWVTVNKVSITISSFSNRAGTATTGKYRFYTSAYSDALAPSSTSVVTTAICDKFNATSNANTYNNVTGFSLHHTEKRFYFYSDVLAELSVADANTWLSSNPIQVVYELAEPTTYQLDPVQVALLIGEQNNIWNNVDITELKLAEVTLDEDQLQTNDLMLSFKSNKICDIKLIVTSQGAVGQFPQGILRQTAGDTIHSNVYVPVWTESNDEFTTTVHLPLALDFWDKGSYTLKAVAIDRQTGLKSSEVGLEFSVAWAHQAPSIEPREVYTVTTDTVVSDDKNYYEYDSEAQVYTVVEPAGTENPHNEGWYEVTITEYVTLETVDETDDTGFHHQAVQINLTPPPNADPDDVYDIYRMTGDGAQLIGQSFPQTYVATDEYAPFGEDLTNHYRIAVRTADGDVEFSDIEYVLEGEGIRLDWAEGFIEYPYSIGIGDSYKKDVDVRKHLDGSIGAYWNRGVERSGSLSTDAIKILQQDDIDLTRRLGRYTGPVFVRTREGTAFEADVQISNLSSKNIAVMSIAIDATEVDLTEEFMLPTPFNLDEGEQ